MSLFQNLNQSPIHINQFYSPKARSNQLTSYQQYFNAKINKQNKSENKQKSSSPNKLHKSKTKPSKLKSTKVNKKPTRPKKTLQDYKTDPMYASKISQMLSQISIPQKQQKITKKQLRQLQNKIMSQILALRQQKIFALEGLNKIVDRKNKAIELLKGYQVLKQNQRIKDEQYEAINNNSSKFGTEQNGNNQSSNNYQSPISKRYQDSRKSKKSNRPLELMNSKLQNEMNRIGTTLTEANKIRQQLMKPLIQNPLLLKNNELKGELEQLKRQLVQFDKNRKKVDQQIQIYRGQNERLIEELEKQRLKFSSLENKRFQTFFPKDMMKSEQLRRLIEVQRDLQYRKQQLQQSMMNGTIIRRAENEIEIQQLRQQNRQLMLNCERLQGGNRQGIVQDEGYGDSIFFPNMSVQQIEQLLIRQMQNKRVLQGMMRQFRQRIGEMQRQNERQNDVMRKRRTRISYYY